MMLYEEGAFELMDPVSRWHPAFADVARLPRRRGAEPVDGARRRADAGLAPADPHVRADVRLPPRARRRRDLPAAWFRVRARRPASTSPPPARLGAAPAALPAGHRVELQRRRPTCWAASSRSSSGQSLDAFFAERILGPLGMTDTGWSVDPSERTGWRRSTRPARTGPAVRNRALGDETCVRPCCSRAAAGWCRPPATTTGSPGCCSSGGELDGARLLGPRTVAYMTRNHLPDGADLEAIGRPNCSPSRVPTESASGSASRSSPTRPPARCSPAMGEYAWGGMASTAF